MLDGGAGVVGAALGAHLREAGYGARCAVVGVPAKWVIAKGHVVPPADAETATAVVRMHAEAEGVPELGEIVFDVSGALGSAAASPVLLAGLPRRWLERVTAVAAAAGLKVVGVTPTAGVLGVAGGGGGGGRGIALSVRPDEAELVVREGRDVRGLRHIGAGVGGAGVGSGAELRRAVALIPGAAGAGVTLWDDVGLEPAAVGAIEAALGGAVVRGEVGMLGGGAAEGVGRAGAAGALALAGLGGERLALDFLRPRIVAPKRRNLSRRRVGGVAAAAAVVLGATWAYTDLAGAEREVARADEELRQLEPALKLAKPFVSDMDFAESFRGRGRARYLACLADLTKAMPAEGRAYLTTFSLHANMTGEFAGRAANHQEVLNLMDQLGAVKRFTDLKRKLDGRGAGAEVAFHVTFTYVPRP
jgi:hypothetical protein